MSEANSPKGERSESKPEPLPDVPEGEQEEGNSNDVKPRTRKNKAAVFPQNLRVEVVEEITPAEVVANPEAYEKIGEREHDLLHHQRAELFWQRTLTGVYKKKDDRQQAPVSAPAPEPPIHGAGITPALAAQIIVAKYCDHLPHYRQAAIWKREQEVQLGRQTINKWTQAIAAHLFAIYEAMGRELRAADTLQIDETPIRYLEPGNGKSKQGYLWVMRHPITGAVYYHWETTRSREGLKRTLGYDESTKTLEYQGTLQCDGYSAYLSLQKTFEGITLGSCLAHIRRKFLNDNSFTEIPWGAEFIRNIQALYRIEREFKEANAPPDERKRTRQADAEPIVTELYQTLIDQQANYRPSSAVGEAIRYALGQWEGFKCYLTNGELDIDNNGVENAIRPTKLGAKNYLFFGSSEAGEYNAVLYTIVENCRVLGLNPREYIERAIEAKAKNPSELLTPAMMHATLQTSQTQVAA